ncbi:MAG: ATP-grasp domain-containing protein [Deltaproteobacteria bacterium]|nr:ATP-grasp domain-containing protein [Deltaproteobacteria bacterium]
MTQRMTVAVTGLNATDNPGPGVSVIRALREAEDIDLRVVGLAYDAMEPGIYAKDIVDDVYLIPYPSEGVEALEARLREIHAILPLDVVIPTLDAELPSFIALRETLNDLGIGTFLPSREQFDLRSKVHLQELGEDADIDVPRAKTVIDVGDMYRVHEEIPYPFYVKGLYYGASLARGVDEAVMAFHRVVATWGLPVIVQQAVDGEEFDVVAVGDGDGGLVGAVPMKKTFITDKGKGWAGITVKDPALRAIAERFMAHTRWRGPLEIEVMKSHDGRYYLLEVNPRFPAWTYLSAGAGMNLPAAVLRLAAGLEPDIASEYRVGTMFVRISLDQIASLDDFQKLATAGALSRSGVAL